MTSDDLCAPSGNCGDTSCAGSTFVGRGTPPPTLTTKKQLMDWAYRQANKESLKKSKAAYYYANKEKDKERRRKYSKDNSAKTKERCKQWAKLNRDYIKQYVKQSYAKNKDRHKAKHAEYYASNRDVVKAKTSAYAKANAAKVREMQRAYRIENKEKLTSSKREWRRNNREKSNNIARLSCQKRYAIKKQATIGDTKQISDWFRAWKAKRIVKCYWCRKKVSSGACESDHIVALANGGPHCVENLCISCAGCNRKKSFKPLETWNDAIAEPVFLF